MEDNIISNSFKMCESIWDNLDGTEKTLIVGDHSGLISVKLNEKLGKDNVVTLEKDKLMIELGAMNNTSYNIENKELEYERKNDDFVRYDILHHYKQYLMKEINDESFQKCDRTTVEEMSSKYNINFDTLIVDVTERESINSINLKNFKKVIMFSGHFYPSIVNVDRILNENFFRMSFMTPMGLAYLREVKVWERV